MNIRDFQTTLKQRTLQPESRDQSFLKLIEEVGQLAEALRTRARYQPSAASIKGTIDEELADVLYALFTIANFHSIDIEQAITLKEQLSQLRQAEPTVALSKPSSESAVTVPIIPPVAVESETVAATAPQDQTLLDDSVSESMSKELSMSLPATELKSIAQRFVNELWNERKLDAADELFSENCITNQLRSGTEPVTAPRTPAAVKKQVSDWVTAFPDFRYTVRQMLTDGDKVMILCVANGTHQGNWIGIPPTGKAISIETMITQRIADGKIVEDWVLADFLGLFQQLGLVAPLQELLAARKN